jgi:hypothetical protein
MLHRHLNYRVIGGGALYPTMPVGLDTQRRLYYEPQMLRTGQGESRTIEYSLDQTRLTIP